MPAPPARSRSASVPCGVSSTSSSPCRYWRSNSLFSPTYDDTIRRIRLSRSSSQPPVVDATVVGDRLEIGHSRVEQRLDQHARDAAQPKPSDRQRRTVRDVGDRLRRTPHDLVHVHSLVIRVLDACPRAFRPPPREARCTANLLRCRDRRPRATASGCGPRIGIPWVCERLSHDPTAASPTPAPRSPDHPAAPPRRRDGLPARPAGPPHHADAPVRRCGRLPTSGPSALRCGHDRRRAPPDQVHTRCWRRPSAPSPRTRSRSAIWPRCSGADSSRPTARSGSGNAGSSSRCSRPAGSMGTPP